MGYLIMYIFTGLLISMLAWVINKTNSIKNDFKCLISMFLFWPITLLFSIIYNYYIYKKEKRMADKVLNFLKGGKKNGR